MKSYTKEELTEAFNLVLHPDQHWKDPICSKCPTDKQEIVDYAIDYFVGGGANFYLKEGALWVEACGYLDNDIGGFENG